MGDVCDMDDDGDGVADDLDDCPTGAVGWWSTRSSDHDEDGCRDNDEDFDDDEDGVFDHNDACPKGPVGWVSTPEEDQEGDGCSDVDIGFSLTLDASTSGGTIAERRRTVSPNEDDCYREIMAWDLGG